MSARHAGDQGGIAADGVAGAQPARSDGFGGDPGCGVGCMSTEFDQSGPPPADGRFEEGRWGSGFGFLLVVGVQRPEHQPRADTGDHLCHDVDHQHWPGEHPHRDSAEDHRRVERGT